MKHIFGKKYRKQKIILKISIQFKNTENSKKEKTPFQRVKAVKDTELKTNGENTVCKNAFYNINTICSLRKLLSSLKLYSDIYFLFLLVAKETKLLSVTTRGQLTPQQRNQINSLFQSFKQHLILRYFQRIDAHSVVNAQFQIVVDRIIGFLIEKGTRLIRRSKAPLVQETIVEMTIETQFNRHVKHGFD